ncbi:hypothetical protein XENOCAPTIV_028917, partial [Xenoophorus captivus]
GRLPTSPLKAPTKQRRGNVNRTTQQLCGSVVFLQFPQLRGTAGNTGKPFKHTAAAVR